MRKKLLTLGLTLLAAGAMAQSGNGYKFTDEIRLACPPVQNQGNSGTCWCFSTTSFLESEMMANGNPNPPNLSEMFIVKNNYIDHAEKYVMLAGNLTFGEGSYFLDNLKIAQKYGLMPESAFPNTQKSSMINHEQLISWAKNFADSVTKRTGVINPLWIEDYKNSLDNYFVQQPDSFLYAGKYYTPRTFADSVVRLNFNDYIQMTSFSHHEFNKFITLEIPDNWRWSRFLNVELDDLIAAIDTSLAKGHTVLWASDVSEHGFEMERGHALLPGISTNNEQIIANFKSWPPQRQMMASRRLTTPGLEMSVTQESRQQGFMDKSTTDDHGMHIIGTAKDQTGNQYYIVKNSWGKTGKYDGYLYVSKNYVKAKTTGIMVHKSACQRLIDMASYE